MASVPWSGGAVKLGGFGGSRPQRELILSVLQDFEALATADEVYEQVHDVSTSVDFSTVYRTLELLKELKLMNCVDAGDAQRRYELQSIHCAFSRQGPSSSWR